MKNTLVLTGGYTKNGANDGICVYRMDESGALTKLATGGDLNPTYLALDSDARRLYCVNELMEYGEFASSAVSAYELDPKSGALRFINRRPTWGENACNIELSPDRRHVMVANFSGGSIAVFPVEAESGVDRVSCFYQHKGSSAGPHNQDKAHAHQGLPDREGRFVIVPDLGSDEVFVYEADWAKGHLIPIKSKTVRAEPGMGPRVGVFDASGRRLYLVGELGSAMLVYDYDSKDGTLKPLQTISMLPEGYAQDNIAAAVRLHPNGKLLFASNRGHDSIAVYHVVGNGLLKLWDIKALNGKTPRDFDLTPDGSYLIAGLLDSAQLVVFSVDAESGALDEVERYACGAVTSVLAAEVPL